MKSIMQEDSSIAKAIEKAWIRAEKPQSFSVKVLEEPEKNFFGITVKSAKIAFFFDEIEPKASSGSYTKSEKRESRPNHKAPKDSESRQEKIQKQTTQKLEGAADTEKKAALPEQTPRNTRPKWSASLVQDAETWITQVLQHMGKPSQSFTTKVKNNNLIFTFEKPVLENADQERLLFSSFAHLLSQALKNKFKYEARGLKIILQSS